MNTAIAVTAIIAAVVGMLGLFLGTVYFIVTVLGQRIDDLGHRLDRIESRLDDIGTRLTVLETDLGARH